MLVERDVVQQQHYTLVTSFGIGSQFAQCVEDELLEDHCVYTSFNYLCGFEFRLRHGSNQSARHLLSHFVLAHVLRLNRCQSMLSKVGQQSLLSSCSRLNH